MRETPDDLDVGRAREKDGTCLAGHWFCHCGLSGWSGCGRREGEGKRAKKDFVVGGLRTGQSVGGRRAALLLLLPLLLLLGGTDGSGELIHW